MKLPRMKRKFSAPHGASAKALLAGLFFLGISARSRADVTWEKESREITAEAGQKVVRTEYTFTNKGTASVSVLAIKPSCGCVATSLEKLDYAPGESGTIKVTFDSAMDKGDPEQERTIDVTTSDTPGTPKALQLKVHVPETVTATPEELVWPQGKEPAAKEVVVKAGAGVKDVKLTQVGSNDNFLVEMKTEIEGQSYRVKVTPKNTVAPSAAELQFKVESPSFKHDVSCEIQLEVK